MTIAITAQTAFTPLRSIDHAVVLVDQGRIVSVGSRDEIEIPSGAHFIDLRENILAPGFIDIHIHGGAGHDVMAQSRDGLARFERSLTNYGVTSYCPTTVTAPLDSTFQSLAFLAEAKSFDRDASRARPLGIHLEGPFISHARRGVHPPENLLAPTPELFNQLWQAADASVAVMTIAPELPGALETIKAAAAHDVLVSLGHSDATLAQAQAGVAAGGRHATHTFNAMRPLDHREPGILGEVLANDNVTAEIIADGIHVHPEMVSLFVRAKGIDRALLVTDATSATGMGDGRFMLGKFEVVVSGDRCEHDGRLAGSVLTLDRAVCNAREFARLSLRQSVQLATLNPARALHRDDIGIIAPGARADFAVLSPAGEVQRTIIGEFLE